MDIFGCVTNGWELLKNNMGVVFVGALIYLLIEIAIGGLSSIPLIGSVFSIANYIISGPLIAGLFFLFIRVIRNEPAEIGDIFSGFRRGFGQLFLGTLVSGLLICVCLLPFIIMFLVKFFPLIGHFHHLQPGTPPDHGNDGGT